MAEIHLSTLDYSIFIIMLSVSASIGVYFGISSRKQQATANYLYGNRQMKAIPVGLSLYSSSMSAIAIIGLPYEIYNFGTHHITIVLGFILGMFLTWYTVLPVFCGNLNIKTPYEYFEKRFDYKIRLISTGILVLNSLMMMPLTLYAPGVALSHVTQIPLLASTTVIGGVCILYTTFGGFKTVIWTDTLQATFMVLSCVIIAIVGIEKAGGLAVVWNKAQQGDLIHFFDMDPSPLRRITFWTITFGGALIQFGHSGCTASALQRYMSLPSARQARISTLMSLSAHIVLQILAGFIGLAMYAIYFKCDPKLHGDIKVANQITTYFVTHTIRDFPGLNGFFMAGLLSATLSTLSSELNTIGGLVYYDVILKFFKKEFLVTRAMTVMQLIILVQGAIYLCTVLFVQSPHIYQIALGVAGVTYGAKIGMILLAIFFLKTNTKGVICGVIASIAIMTWVNVGAIMYNVNSYYLHEHSTDHCPVSNVSITNIANSSVTNVSGNVTSTYMETLLKPKLEDIFFLYRLSLFHYALLGTIITILVGVIVSHVTGPNDPSKIDPLLVSPLLRTYVRKQQRTMEEM